MSEEESVQRFDLIRFVMVEVSSRLSWKPLTHALKEN